MKLSAKERALYLKLYDQKPSTLPSYARPKPKMKWTRRSNFLEDLVCLWAKIKGFSASKIDVKGTYRNGQYHTTGATKGVSDVIILADGLFIAVEVKIGEDSQSDIQKKWQDQIEENKGIYLIAKDIQIIDRLNQLTS